MNIIIHPNRWLIWTIALIVMIFIVVWGAIERYAIEQEYSYTGDEIYYSVRLHKKSAGISGWKTYRNEKYGFELRHPPNVFGEPEARTHEGYSFVGSDTCFTDGIMNCYISVDIQTLEQARKQDTLAVDCNNDDYGVACPTIGSKETEKDWLRVFNCLSNNTCECKTAKYSSDSCKKMTINNIPALIESVSRCGPTDCFVHQTYHFYRRPYLYSISGPADSLAFESNVNGYTKELIMFRRLVNSFEFVE